MIEAARWDLDLALIYPLFYSWPNAHGFDNQVPFLKLFIM